MKILNMMVWTCQSANGKVEWIIDFGSLYSCMVSCLTEQQPSSEIQWMKVETKTNVYCHEHKILTLGEANLRDESHKYLREAKQICW